MDSRSTTDQTTTPLARRADFELGRASIRPSMRTVQGPAGTATAEPRVMQVLLALADADGAVLSREDLLQICWGGRIVGDDAINRAVAEARRISVVTGAGYQIETIPRIGYRLSLDGVETGAGRGVEPAAVTARTSRRTALLLGGGALAAASLGSFGIVAWQRQSEVQVLLTRGKQLQARSIDRPNVRAAGLYRKAITLDPNRAEAWGLLAGAILAIRDDAELNPAPPVSEALEAANKALALDPREPNARITLAALRRGLDDWITFENELREVLADAPDTFSCYIYLSALMQGVGRCRESWAFNEGAIRLEPLSPTAQFRRGFKHWIFGLSAEANRISERTLELWPTHPLVWNARLTILAFTGRHEAALRMLEGHTGPPDLGSQATELWKVGLRALGTRSSRDIAKTREACFRYGIGAPGIGAVGVMLLSELNDVDAAYQMAEGFLMRRGRLLERWQGGEEPSGLYATAGWRQTQWLFAPPSRALRQDPRFTAFCAELGYVDYWRRRKIWPDIFVRGSLLVT